MVLLAVIGQALDLASYGIGFATTQHHEANPLIALLGIWAVPTKLGLVGLLVYLGLRYGESWTVRFTLALACAAGFVGFLGNVGLLMRP